MSSSTSSPICETCGRAISGSTYFANGSDLAKCGGCFYRGMTSGISNAGTAKQHLVDQARVIAELRALCADLRMFEGVEHRDECEWNTNKPDIHCTCGANELFARLCSEGQSVWDARFAARLSAASTPGA